MRSLMLALSIFSLTAATISAVSISAAETPAARVGTVATVYLNGKFDENAHKRLHFCVFENGMDDYIYVGTKYGGWYDGEFELSLDGKRVFSSKVPTLLYGGVMIPMGDVLETQPDSNIDVHVTKLSGQFK